MSNAQMNKAFFAVIDAKTKTEVLLNISEHYGISKLEALEEVTSDDAEHLLDYVTGPMRAATSVLFQRHRIT